ncbi:MAG: hypothetical protein IBJ10_05275 [Phycisphaerales bacterium]|nr:hypothetical protein [Phycisphaerales bacterium]
MGPRLLTILILLHGLIAPALWTVPTTPSEPPAACCAGACACDACPCSVGEAPGNSSPTPAPISAPRADDALRTLLLPGGRVIDAIPPATLAIAPAPRGQSRHRTPATFRGASAQAALCVRTT